MSEKEDKKNAELDDLRKKVDESNLEIVKAIGKRFVITRKIGELKAKENLPACNPKRENGVLDRVMTMAKNENLDEIMVKNIFKIIMEKVVEEHKEIRENGGKNDGRKN